MTDAWRKATKRPVTVEYRDAVPGETIETPEGALTAKAGDVIIRGIKGELYPCARDVFDATYTEPDPVLDRLGERLRTQDNRATGEPLFVVQHEEKIWGIDPGWGDSTTCHIWQDVEDPEYTYDSFNELREEALRDGVQDIPEFDPGDNDITIGDREYVRIFYNKIYRFVCAHFTEAAAQAYIDANIHNLKNPRIYVTSQYRCDEWNAVRNMLLDRNQETP